MGLSGARTFALNDMMNGLHFSRRHPIIAQVMGDAGVVAAGFNKAFCRGELTHAVLRINFVKY
jgi:hypothetical protein